MRVLTFSLGFGPKILKVKRGDTEYCVSAIPLGGYVKMAGENPTTRGRGSPTSSCRRPSGSGSRSCIAGPAMNIILAVVVLAFVLAQGAEVPVYLDEPPSSAWSPGSPAEKGGTRPAIAS